MPSFVSAPEEPDEHRHRVEPRVEIVVLGSMINSFESGVAAGHSRLLLEPLPRALRTWPPQPESRAAKGLVVLVLGTFR